MQGHRCTQTVAFRTVNGQRVRSVMRGNYTYEKEKRGKAEAKYQGSGKVCVVHDVLVNTTKGVKNRHRLGSYVRKVDAEFWRGGGEHA